MRLSKYSLDAALKEKSTRNTRERLKDLPNMSFHLEAILGEVGIKDVRALSLIHIDVYKRQAQRRGEGATHQTQPSQNARG